MNASSEEKSIGSSLQIAMESLPPKINDGQCCYHTLEDMILNPKKLQQHLTADIAKKQSTDYMECLSQDKDAGRTRSLLGCGSGAGLEAVPINDKCALKPNKFCLVSYLLQLAS